MDDEMWWFKVRLLKDFFGSVVRVVMRGFWATGRDDPGTFIFIADHYPYPAQKNQIYHS